MHRMEGRDKKQGKKFQQRFLHFKLKQSLSSLYKNFSFLLPLKFCNILATLIFVTSFGIANFFRCLIRQYLYFFERFTITCFVNFGHMIFQLITDKKKCFRCKLLSEEKCFLTIKESVIPSSY
jgi:hypothetical protein